MGVKFLIDTNTLSELERIRPNRGVVNSFLQHSSEVAMASITWHELLFGYHRLPSSKRKDRIRDFLFQTVEPVLPIIPFDAAAAAWLAHERARLTALGRPPAFTDGQIAVIALVNGLTLVTRNTAVFEPFDTLSVENWFD